MFENSFFIRLCAIFMLLMGTWSCSQRLLRVEPLKDLKETDGIVKITLKLPLEKVSMSLTGYLKNKNRFKKKYELKDRTTIFVQKWRRDLSLRYYRLKFDNKERHICEWQMSWTLKPIGPNKTELTIKTLDIVFIGSPENARGGPASLNPKSPKKQNSWFEMPPDKLRSIVELKSFMSSTFPAEQIPIWISEFKSPELKGQTLVLKQELNSDRWKPSSRNSAF